MKTMEQLLNKIRELGWSIEEYEENYELGIYSPADQDFSMIVEKADNIKYFIGNIYKVYSDFDVSYETYLWLDEKEFYEDMKWCEDAIYDLYKSLKDWINN